jgi:hypothetical protein
MKNNIINRIDKNGLYTELLIMGPGDQPAEWWGHAAININGTVYSYAADGMMQLNVYIFINNYIEENRTVDGLVLKLTPDEEEKIEHYLLEYDDDHTYFPLNMGSKIGNCTKPITNGLAALKHILGGVLTPSQLKDEVVKSDIFLGYSHD